MACTSFVNANVVKCTKEVGFQQVYLAPLKVSSIQREIIPLVIEREGKIEKMNEMSKLSDLIVDMQNPDDLVKDLLDDQLKRISSNMISARSNSIKNIAHIQRRSSFNNLPDSMDKQESDMKPDLEE